MDTKVLQRWASLRQSFYLVCLVICTSVVAGAEQAPIYEYRGAIHIHSVFSDGSGTIEHIAAEAAKADLDFIIMTDHNTLKPLAAGKQKWYGKVLVLVGTELSLPSGHCLAMNINDIPSRETTQTAIDAITKAGGLTFIAHPTSETVPWLTWDTRGITGMEVVSLGEVLTEKGDEVRIRAIVGILTLTGVSFLDWIAPVLKARPNAGLALWDEQTQKGPLVGIGVLDAHARVRFGKTVLKLPPYGEEFRALRTHIFTREPFNGDVSHDAAVVYNALRAGHCSINYAVVTRSKGFSFSAKAGRAEAMMGDTIALSDGLTLEASAPRRARQRFLLVKDGQVILKQDKPAFSFQVTERGTYRVEVYVSNLPIGGLSIWALSNPIYVR